MMTEKTPGRRALNKADKLQRIRAAARELFIENGYDGTTLRDISARGKIGFGTIFDYASSKRDLLFLILNPALVQALDDGYAAALKEQVYVEQLMKLFESFYRLYEAEPSLSRYLLRELNFYREGAEAEKFLAQRADFLIRLADLTKSARAAGKIASDERPELVAQALMSLFAWEVRRWISIDPLSLDDGLRSLRVLIALQVRGLEPGPDAL